IKIHISIALLVVLLIEANAQKLDVAYVPTPDSVVEKMLDMANVGPGDYLIDLGCGDGRINIAAAKRGALGHGVDLDSEIIKVARENAANHGVSDKVFFIEENIYETDFSRATVIAMYLFPSINIKLRPKFLETLKPGTRIVSHDFAMDEWKPDRKIGRMENHAVLLWIVPAQVAGCWTWQTDGIDFTMKVKQKFQEIEAEVFVDDAILEVKNSALSGDKIILTVINKSNQKKFVFSGLVEGDEITGTVKTHDNKEVVKKWNAKQD
ncbi:MAG: class I SAM-dependent methyltransferase, partial [Draconibacterium sp.]|nr:class I SAM-dependent methyltransferase [Draconibacterium sp.]